MRNATGQPVSLNALRTYAVAARLLSFTAAAQELHVSQAAVSRQVRLLEEELKSTLLQRAGRGVKLTDAGEILRVRAIDLLRQADDLRSELRNRGRAPTGVLRIGANPSLGEAMFPALASRYTAAFPGVRLHLVTDMTMHIQEAIQRGTLDCGVIAFPDRDPALVVGDQQPYSGVLLNATMNRHAEANGIPYVGIEIRQDLIGDPAGQAAWAGRLATMLDACLKGLKAR